MRTTDTIAITGAAGFIGSYLVGHLNRLGFQNLVLVDDFSNPAKAKNLEGKTYREQVNRDDFFAWANGNAIQHIFHLGARTDTTEMDYEVHKRLNLDYSKKVWQLCIEQNIPLVYASSAATYGNGEFGYKDSHEIVEQLAPLNPYGRSKNEFDIWALSQKETPPFWVGLKFFNVYGPNEYHKGRMASVIFHAYRQIKNNGKVKLFRSHNPEYRDGEQMRDFIYVIDIVSICLWLMEKMPASGLYNAGTGKAETFKSLVTAIFDTLSIPVNIEYIDTPADIRDKYQYFTEADMSKLRAAGYDRPFQSLQAGINGYVGEFLEKGLYF
ncbi:ADP-glyceromanno-heptose 6-epimerase [Polluticoccus soli]|uniref:ADP-glyceromanno-heptose 6-epimerase n=1 Tax=Polluticoccus soli TaxID=3034150 RepID=UPI0023E2D670|nr:ADP-glyceromanno-heptose 6-epimerase [Flavipsychrobacter sp. JY13-12]